MKKFLILGAASVALFSLPALAEHGGPHDGKPPHAEKIMEKLDVNGDGTVTKEEFMSETEKRFNETDANSDGKVTKEEFQARMEQKRKEREERRAAAKKATEEGRTPPADAPAAPPVEEAKPE